jgi:hypothetical protein
MSGDCRRPPSEGWLRRGTRVNLVTLPRLALRRPFLPVGTVPSRGATAGSALPAPGALPASAPSTGGAADAAAPADLSGPGDSAATEHTSRVSSEGASPGSSEGSEATPTTHTFAGDTSGMCCLPAALDDAATGADTASARSSSRNLTQGETHGTRLVTRMVHSIDAACIHPYKASKRRRRRCTHTTCNQDAHGT